MKSFLLSILFLGFSLSIHQVQAHLVQELTKLKDALSQTQKNCVTLQKALTNLKVVLQTPKSKGTKSEIIKPDAQKKPQEPVPLTCKIQTLKEFLKEHKLDNVKSFDATGKTALHLAIKEHDLGLIDTIIKAGADVNAQTKFQNTPLHAAIEAERLDVITLLLKVPEIKLDLQNVNGNTPLHRVVQKNYKKGVEALLAKGAKINIGDDEDNTPLHFAAHLGYEEIVPMLLKAKADIKAKNKHGNTPFDIAKTDDIKELLK